ncbi:MAG: thioredoxin family protein [Leptospirales bacterium]
MGVATANSKKNFIGIRKLLVVLFLFIGLSNMTFPKGISWKTDSKGYEYAMGKNKTSGTPVFLYFYTDWCSVCKSVKSQIFPDQEVQKVLREFVSVQVDAEQSQNGSLVHKYMSKLYGGGNSFGVPELLLIEPKTGRWFRVPFGAFSSAARFTAYLKKFLKGEIPYFAYDYDKNPKMTNREMDRGSGGIAGYIFVTAGYTPPNPELASMVKNGFSNNVWSFDAGLLAHYYRGIAGEMYLSQIVDGTDLNISWRFAAGFNFLDLKKFQGFWMTGFGIDGIGLSFQPDRRFLYMDLDFVIFYKLKITTGVKIYRLSDTFVFNQPMWTISLGYSLF